MKLYFWDGSEFNGTASPCCEVHIRGRRIKLMVMNKYKTTWYYSEKL